MNKIDTILKDLYAIEPSLKQKEQQLRPLVERMIANRPNVKIDERFVQELRSTLVEHALSLPKPSPYAWLFSRRTVFATVGTLALLLIVGPIVRDSIKTSPLTFGSQIEAVEDGAFGDLSLTSPSAKGLGGGNAEIATAPNASFSAETKSQSTGKPYSSEDSGGGSSQVLGMGMGVAASEPAVMSTNPARSMMYPYPGPDPYTLKFQYEGDGSFETFESLPVYKRSLTAGPSTEFSAVLGSMNFDLADLGSFSNLKVGTISLQEDRPFGYHIDLNLKENQLYIYKNWEKWPQPEYRCMALGCESSLPALTKADIPSDEELFRIADEFLATHGIDTSSYGEKSVSGQNFGYPLPLAEKEAAASQVYIPDEIAVIYQLMVDGKPVFDEAGTPAGLNVSVDIRNKRVAGVNMVMPQNYRKSNYPAIADAGEIIKEATNGGRFGGWGYPDTKNTKTVTLGTPKLILMRTWLPQTEPGQSGEIYVPAYAFPVTQKPTDVPFMPDHVLVPAIKGLFPDTPTVLPADVPVMLEKKLPQ